MNNLFIKNLSAKYGKHQVLKKISLEMNSSQINFIIGPNGCGKTTFLRCINRLKEYEGSILLNGKRIEQLKRNELAKHIAMISQITSLSFSYSLFDTVLMGRYCHKKDMFSSYTSEDKRIVLQCLEKVGLLEDKDKMLHTCSGGQMQRVFIARMLAQNPMVILLDEMTNHLDFKYQIELLNFITKWAKEENKIVIGVLHDINLVNQYADKIFLMNQGNIVSEGDAKSVLTTDNLIDVFEIDIKTWLINSARKWSD